MLRRSLSAVARTSLADGADFDGSEGEAETPQKTGLVTVLTASSVRVLERFNPVLSQRRQRARAGQEMQWGRETHSPRPLGGCLVRLVVCW